MELVLNSGHYTSGISEVKVINKNGIIYQNGVWAQLKTDKNKVGDIVLAYNAFDHVLEKLKSGNYQLTRIIELVDNSDFPYRTTLGLWRQAYKINLNKPLQPQIDEFINSKNESI